MKQFKTIPLTLEKGVLFTMLFLLVVFGYLSSLDPFRESISGHATADDSDSSSELTQKETTLYILGGLILGLLGLYLFLMRKK
ncbi:TPA: LPXTG cell wall anchor domain-containing protein [Candidatus Woesearchaeota archaeon]|nr:LPXTG cell wall anchor domain-containing protein [Candidatus Woesearchaeota archaeon]